jgi:hypothetical protein
MASLNRSLHANTRKSALFDMAMSPAQVMDFMHQTRTGGSWNDFADAFKHGPQHFFERVGNEFSNPKSQLANEFTNPNSELRHDVVPAFTKVASAIAPVANFIVPGSGIPLAAAAQGINAANTIGNVAQGAGKLGLARRFPVGTLRFPAAGSGRLGRTRRYAKGTLRLPARATSAMAGSGRYGPRGMRRVVSARRGKGIIGDAMNFGNRTKNFFSNIPRRGGARMKHHKKSRRKHAKK